MPPLGSTDTSVLRFPRSDESGGFVLVHVSYTGPALLDLTLTATEGESPYVRSVKQAQLQDLRAKNYQGTNEEWVNIVSLILGRRSAPLDEPDWATGLEASVNIAGSNEDNKELIITIRKRVQSITQRLGNLILKQDDEQSIELFDWAGITAANVHRLENQLLSLTGRCRIAEESIQKLSEQLDNLMRAKTQHENRLVANFVQLLNEKKLKIRNQQRLLASTTGDDTVVSSTQSVIPDRLPKTVEKSLPAKKSARKSSDTEDSGASEPMEIDSMTADRLLTNHQGADNEEHTTPHSLDDEQDNSTTDDDPLHESARLKRVSSAGDTAPPQRDLPFTRRTGGPVRQMAPSMASEDAEETAEETDDDEL